MRVFRLAIGIFGIAQAFVMSDVIVGVLGAAIVGMAFFNVGCCGVGGCDLNYQKDNDDSKSEPVFEEVVQNKK